MDNKGHVSRIISIYPRHIELRFFHYYIVSLFSKRVMLEILPYLSVVKDALGLSCDNSFRQNIAVVRILPDGLSIFFTDLFYFII